MPQDNAGQTQTDWSMIFDAAHGDAEDATHALDRVARRYWPAVYAYIRSTGRDVHEASDLTQGFICDVVIGRKLLNVADPHRGRFRSLLRRSLQNYLHESLRTSTQRNPSPGRAMNLLSPDRIAHIEADQPRSPEDAFDAQWTVMMIHTVMDRVRLSCLADGLEPHWSVFEQRILHPMLTGSAPVPYDLLVQRLELRDASQASNMMVTVKRRFARELYQEISATVTDPSLTEQELSHLLRVLEKVR